MEELHKQMDALQKALAEKDERLRTEREKEAAEKKAEEKAVERKRAAEKLAGQRRKAAAALERKIVEERKAA